MPKLTPSVGKPPEVSFKAGERIVHVVRAIDAAFDQQASGADDLRVLGDERPLLGGGGPRDGRDRKKDQNQSEYAHEESFRRCPSSRSSLERHAVSAYTYGVREPCTVKGHRTIPVQS